MADRSKPIPIDKLETDARVVLCPICKQTEQTKVARVSHRIVRTFIIILSLISFVWCLMCMISPPKTATHRCGRCGVRLCKVYIPPHAYDPRRTLASYVSSRLSQGVQTDQPGNDQLPAYELRDNRPKADSPPTYSGDILSPLRLSPPGSLSSKTSSDSLSHVLTINAPRGKKGEWTILSANEDCKYTFSIDSFPVWSQLSDGELVQRQSALARSSPPWNASRIHIERSSTGSSSTVHMTIAIDGTRGSWTTYVEAGGRLFSFSDPDKEDGVTNNWELDGREGPLFWGPLGRCQTLVDAYERPCAELRLRRPYSIRLSPCLDAMVVDEVVGATVGLLIQRQRWKEWYALNHDS